MLEYLLKRFKGYEKTCSITNVINKSVTFIRNDEYAHFLDNICQDIWIIVPKGFQRSVFPTVNMLIVDDPDYVFTIYHNEIHKHDRIPDPIIGSNCKIHPTVVMNVEGFKVANAPDGSKVQFIHTGNIIIDDNVEIGPYTVVHRGTMDPTIIKKGVKIGAKNNIAHNNIIGENTVFAAGVITNGSVTIGKNCWISSGALIRNGVSICDNTVIGLGAVVVKDIAMPGIYVGNPAYFLKPLKDGWNF